MRAGTGRGGGRGWLARRRCGPERSEEERAVGSRGDDAGRNGPRRSAPLARAATLRAGTAGGGGGEQRSRLVIPVKWVRLERWIRMSSADDRRFEVLRAIVSVFVSTGEPIGSKSL